MGRFQRSLALAKESYTVLRSNPDLVWFPVVSSIFTILLTISFMLPLYFAAGGAEGLKKTDHMPPSYYVVLAAFYLCSYFIVIFFNSALVSCAHATLSGGRMTFMGGIQAAAKLLPAILGWALVAATVGMILQLISERVGIVGKIVVAILGGAWNLVTFFVVPIIVIEHGSPVAAIKKSGSMLKRTWGENLIGTGGIGLVFFLLALIPIVPIVLACFTGSVAVILGAIGLAIFYWLVIATISASLTGIYRTALYVYAETGTIPSVYEAGSLQAAFRQGKPNIVNRIRGR